MKTFDETIQTSIEKYMEHFHLENPDSPSEIRNIIMFAQTYMQYQNLQILNNTYQNNLKLDKFFNIQDNKNINN